MEEGYLTDVSLIPVHLTAVGAEGSVADLVALPITPEVAPKITLFSPDAEGDFATGVLYIATDGSIPDGVPYTVTPRD